MPLPEQHIPYCGTPPLPEAIWGRWNLDPVLIAVLIAGLAAYLAGERVLSQRSGRHGTRDTALFTCGWLVLSLALVSPLCALSVALFSARIGQHMLIATVAMPLVALGRPLPRLHALTRRRLPGGRLLANKIVSSLLFALFLWLWHTPVFYAATFRSDLVYWTMHVTLAGSAFLLWHGLLTRGLDDPFTAFGCGFATTLQMSLLGAILTFARHPLFAEHLLTASDWSFTPVSDQQLGGLIMWIPGCTVVIVAGIALLGQVLHSLDAAPRREGERGERSAPAAW